MLPSPRREAYREVYNFKSSFLNGIGVAQNTNKGLYWLNEAAKQGYEATVEILGIINDPNVQRNAQETLQILEELGVM